MSDYQDKNPSSVDIILTKEKELQKRKKQRKRRKVITIVSVIFVIVAVIGVYLISDISKVKTVVVSGNVNLSKNTVLETTKVNESDLFLFVISEIVESDLEKNPFIKKATVTKSLDRVVYIEIEEELVLGYRYSSDGAKLIFFDGTSIPLEDKYLFVLPNIPYISGFEGTELEGRLIKGFSSLDIEIFSLIAEIQQYQVSYDDKLVRIRMQDGNQVFTSLNSIDSLNYYYEILRSLKVTNSCIYIDEISGSAYSQVCPEEDLPEPEVPEVNEEG